jgi:hypothetical protein
MRAVPARPSREFNPISAMSWGVEPVRRDQQGKSTIRMGGVYATAGKIASDKNRAINAHRPSPAFGVDVAAPRS